MKPSHTSGLAPAASKTVMNSAWPLNAAFFERAVAVVVDSVEVAAAEGGRSRGGRSKERQELRENGGKS